MDPQNKILQDRILLDADTIRQRVAGLADEISADYRDRNPVLLTLLKGSLYFAADLSRALEIDHTIDFMSVTHGTQGMLDVNKSPYNSLAGRHVLLLEDIIDSGLTLSFIVSYVRSKGPRSLEICTLLDNPARRLVELPLRYIGFTIPDVFVVGYGLDFEENHRHLPFIAEYQPATPGE